MLAGWLHEEAGRKLVVDCAGKGVVFVEADMDIAVAKLSNTRCPPFLFFRGVHWRRQRLQGIAAGRAACRGR